MKKLLSLALCFLMVFSAILPAFAADTAETTPVMTTTADHDEFSGYNPVTNYAFADAAAQNTHLKDQTGNITFVDGYSIGSAEHDANKSLITLWGSMTNKTYNVTFTIDEPGYYSFAVNADGGAAGDVFPVSVDGANTHNVTLTGAYNGNGGSAYYGMTHIWLWAGEHTFNLGKYAGSSTVYYYGFSITKDTSLEVSYSLPAVFANATYIHAADRFEADNGFAPDYSWDMLGTTTIGYSAANGSFKLKFTVLEPGEYAFAIKQSSGGNNSKGRGMRQITVDGQGTVYSSLSLGAVPYPQAEYYTGMTAYLTAGEHYLEFTSALSTCYFHGFYFTKATNVDNDITFGAVEMSEISTPCFAYGGFTHTFIEFAKPEYIPYNEARGLLNLSAGYEHVNAGNYNFAHGAYTHITWLTMTARDKVYEIPFTVAEDGEYEFRFGSMAGGLRGAYLQIDEMTPMHFAHEYPYGQVKYAFATGKLTAGDHVLKLYGDPGATNGGLYSYCFEYLKVQDIPVLTTAVSDGFATADAAAITEYKFLDYRDVNDKATIGYGYWAKAEGGSFDGVGMSGATENFVVPFTVEKSGTYEIRFDLVLDGAGKRYSTFDIDGGVAYRAGASGTYPNVYGFYGMTVDLTAGEHVFNLHPGRDGYANGFAVTLVEEKEVCAHVPGDEATCSAPQTCTLCGEVLAVVSHNYGLYAQTDAPTCTEAGSEAKTCSTCGDVVTRVVPATGHDYTYAAVADEEDPHLIHNTCVCGEYVDSMTEHDYGYATRSDEAHPHAIYNVCVCGDEQATGEYAELDSCPICNPIATKPEGTVNYATAIVDAEMDAAYADSLAIVYDGNNEYNTFKDSWTWQDATATVYALYDDAYVYFYAVVEDDDVVKRADEYYETSNAYGIDGIEFRLNLGGEANAANQFKITIDAHGMNAFNLWADRYPFTTLDKSFYATALTETGYVIEVMIPHSLEGADNTNLIEAGKLGFNMWLLDAQPSAAGTNTNTEASKGTDFIMYGLNYGNGNGVAEYYDLGSKEAEHVCDFTYATETDAEHPHAVYGVCECGEKQLQAESSTVAGCPVCEPFAMSGASMTLGNELSLSFFFPVAKIPAGEECYVVVTKEYADGRADVTRTFYPSEWDVLGGSLYYVSFNGIAAKEMADKMIVQVFNSKGQAISGVWEDSIKDYLTRKFNDFNAEQKTWAVDCLNYGAASQTQFGYDTENLANKDLTEAQKALATQTITMTNTSNMGTKGVGASLALESSIELVVFFSGITDKTGMYAEISFINYKGEEKTSTATAEEFMALGALTGVSVTTMVAADVSQDITITMYNADGSVYGVIVDSVESYAARKSAESPLFEAVMKFGVSARNMFTP